MADCRVLRNIKVYLGYGSTIMVCTGYLNLFVPLQTVVHSKLAEFRNFSTQRGILAISRKGRAGLPNFSAARIYEDFVIRARVITIQDQMIGVVVLKQTGRNAGIVRVVID